MDYVNSKNGLVAAPRAQDHRNTEDVKPVLVRVAIAASLARGAWTKQAETKQAETKQAETKQAETKQAEIDAPGSRTSRACQSERSFWIPPD
jgi:hypothetical protein